MLGSDLIQVTVRHSSSSFTVDVSADASIRDLQELLENKTGVLVRRQKLMCRGRVISGLSGNLKSASIANGAKLMLLAAAGEVQSQGAAALAAAQRAKVAAQQQARQQRAEQGEHAASHSASPTLQARTELWCKTGIASLRDLQLAELPPGLLSPALSSTLRVMDLSGNKLTGLPGSVAGLQALQRLRLSMNCLGDEGTWAPLLQLSQLAVLDVSHNRLTTLPEGVSRLAALQKLAASDNAIGAIPATVGALTALRVLSLSHNQLRGLPAKLGACTALEEAGLSGNQIPEIPDSLSALHSLKLLDLTGMAAGLG